MNAGAWLVVDCSVAVKWHQPEADSDKARLLLDGSTPLVAPDFLLIEVGSVLTTRLRGGLLTADAATLIVEELASQRLLALVPSAPLLGAAMRIAAQHRRSVYDALYVALAVSLRSVLVTADARLYNALQGTDLEPHLMLLGARRP